MFQFLNVLAITVAILPLTKCHKSTNASHLGVNIQQGNPRDCLKKYKTLERFEVFPGTGWDNLRNMDAENVIVYDYSLCKTTLDGRFLIPDDVDTIPQKSSKLNTFSEVISRYTDYTSVTAHSINVHAGLSWGSISIGGSFSDGYQQAKRTQIKYKSVTTRVDVRYVRYTALLKTNFKLDPDFKTKLMDIANSIDGTSGNNTNINEARYKSQLLIRDYGTHFLKSVDAGAVLVLEDEISSDYFSTNDSTVTDMEAAAGASFLNIFNFGTSFETLSSKSNIEKYQRLRLSSKILTFGGPKFMANNFTINDWAKTVDENMVAVDRHGDPLDYLITEANLPELSSQTVYSLKNLVEKAIYVYYKENSYPGCTNLESPNFSPITNIDDGSCTPPINASRFGGVFQTCKLDPKSNNGDICSEKDMNQKNFLTGDYSCPDNYETVKIHSANVTTRRPYPNCFICDDDEFYWCCPNSEYYHYKLSSGNYSMFWCGAITTVPDNSGYLFGGVFTSETINPLTKDKSCPISFYPRKLATDLELCVSDDYEVGRQYADMFGGLFSCESGNPLTINNGKSESESQSSHSSEKSFLNWPKSCPVGYSQHLAYVDNGCEISYCFKSAQTGFVLPNIRRPPFTNDTEPSPPATRDDHMYTVGTIVVATIVSTIGAIVLTSIACIVKQKRSKGYLHL